MLGFLKLPGLTMLAMYLLGIVVALLMAWLFKKTLLKGETPMLIMELPPYKRPLLRVVLRHMWDRSKLFLRRAGTVILGINILLWFLATYPRSTATDAAAAAQRVQLQAQLRASRFARASGRHARPNWPRWTARQPARDCATALPAAWAALIEPVIAPLGFDWKIGIGIITSFAAREVFVSTMSTVYNVGADRRHAVQP